MVSKRKVDKKKRFFDVYNFTDEDLAEITGMDPAKARQLIGNIIDNGIKTGEYNKYIKTIPGFYRIGILGDL